MMYFIISSCTDAVVCFDARHAAVKPDYIEMEFVYGMGRSFEEGTHGFMVFNTPVVHAVSGM